MTGRSPRACVVGSGAREHALALALGRSAEVVVTPGNPGITGRTREGYVLRSTPAPPEEVEADLFVIGPEGPLVAGLADRLRSRGALVLGPGRDGAQLEGSKRFMKEIATAAGIPTARWAAFSDYDAAVASLAGIGGPYVIKTDGLAAGKGVLVTDDRGLAEADLAAKLGGSAFGEAGRQVVIEEAMVGEELSLLVVCDGRAAVPFAPAQDFKRLYDHDLGPNTGGMGAWSPVPVATDALLDQMMAEIIEPALAELGSRGIDYRGVLYAGVMLTNEGPKLVEFNVRLGDPEAEVVLGLLEEDLFGLFCDAAAGQLRAQGRPVTRGAAVAVVATAPGYPLAPRTGAVITGCERAATLSGVTVLHAGTAVEEGRLISAGGRVLTVTAVADTAAQAREAAYSAIAEISFEGMHYRRDIAAAAGGRTGHETAGGMSAVGTGGTTRRKAKASSREKGLDRPTGPRHMLARAAPQPSDAPRGRDG
jgi:phosphoribosylamine--glycine ligase